MIWNLSCVRIVLTPVPNEARHILCEKLSKMDQCLEEIKEAYPGKIQGSKFGEFAKKFSECSSGNSGGKFSFFEYLNTFFTM